MTPETVFVALVGGGVLVVLSAVLLVMTLIGGVQRQTNRRMATIAQRWRHQGAAELPGVRRDSADSSLRSFDRLIKTVLPHPQVLRQRLARTGLKISIGEYVLTSAFVGLLGVLVVVVIVDQGPVLAGCVGLTCAFAVPHIFVWFLTRRRQKKFTSQFPEAIDLIVRGLKSGLPVTESMKVVAKEIQRPVGEEFQLIVDKLAVGTTMEDALWDTAARIDTPEAKFFVVSLSVQRETGGNLAETLENLSDVLRKRFQMKQKVKAMASEPKASAMILGALPFIMFGVIALVNNEYVMTLIHDVRGHKLILVGLFSQSIGIAVMVKMVNFEI